MSSTDDALRREKIDAVIAQALTHVPKAERNQVEACGREYFRRLDDEDLNARSVEDMLGALLSLWQFAATREPGATRVRVLSPTVAETGWSSRHSVIEIINDDMPFLVDSVTMEINRQGLTLHMIVHPIYAVERDTEGQRTSVATRRDQPQHPRESWMHVEIDRLVDVQERNQMAEGLQRVLGDVRNAVQDWQPMLERMRETITELRAAPAALAQDVVDESVAFLEWLVDDHLTLLGYRCHDLITAQGVDALRLIKGSGLGVLRETQKDTESASFAALPEKSRALARSKNPIVIVTKANTRSTIHRVGYTDYIGVKRFNAAGEVIGEHRFLGLFTSSAYSERAADTPLLRAKVAAVAAVAGLTPGSHLAKAMHHLLETYPRDDLFQISEEALHETAVGILALGQRQRLRLFLWQDPFDRYVSCLVYVPREAYSTEMRVRFQQLLMAAFDGSNIDFDVLLGDNVLARIHLTVRTTPGAIPAYNRREIETRLAAAARRWEDDLRDALVEAEGEARGLKLFKRWGSAFPAGYRERVLPGGAVADLRKIDALTPQAPVAMALYRPLGAAPGALGFKVYRLGEPLVLSDGLPMLEYLGARVHGEHNHQVRPIGDEPGQTVYLHDFDLHTQAADGKEPEHLAHLFEDTFAQVLSGAVENDEFNRLVLTAGLSAQEVVVLRAYAKYLRQIRFSLPHSAVKACLAAHPAIARQLSQLFVLRFDPVAQDADAAKAKVAEIEAALEDVSNLSEDRILRQLRALILATQRTNFWRTGVGHSGDAGPRRSFLSFKFDSAQVPGMPEPKPLYEIFVYSPRFEGCHLRGGMVARGGLRWSDRADDFRTEVLGLVKAQMVKNTVIVPVGSKGGFVLKAVQGGDREAWLKEGVACYQDYLRALLDLTDNRVGDEVVPPPQVVRHDGDDPYLVVAADKGTATFSDYANAISAEYGHWLGDAFASGGSVGYDHKGMGITARGAWESVTRHFRELGVDTQNEPFTVAGIGDMSGDVFGNGMLLSQHIRLVAAFDHRHIFIDPDPDAARSFAERERLFKLPRSSWADYETSLLSVGGGVWSRTEKSISLSEQMRAVLGIDAERLAPSELVSAILKAPVDLLYNGGIGTYFKASSESHTDVGDRANDGLRVDANELRCKVVAEGGNLGCTQLGRIEAAQHGVRIYTDAIDNSAGVETSDHEVNIKILLGLAVADGEMTEKQRNALLPQMTDEVAALVLRDNYFQTQALSVAARQGAALLDAQARFMRYLEKKGQLNRAIEYLPTDDEVAERKLKGQALTTPEIATLLAYSKMWLSDELMRSELPEDPWVMSALERYFPTLLREQFAAYIPRHPLRREIVATHVLNSMVNRVGPTFVHGLHDMTGAAPAQVVRAYLASREVFGLVDLWLQIEALDNRVPDATQAEMILALRALLWRATSWFLRSKSLAEPLGTVETRFAPAVVAMAGLLVADHAPAQAAAWEAAGVPTDLAHRVAMAAGLFAALDATELSAATGRRLQDVCQVHLSLGKTLGLARLREQILALPIESHWQQLAKAALGDDLSGLQRAIAGDVVQAGDGDAAAMLAAWEQRSGAALKRAQRTLTELGDAREADLAMLSVALRELRNLA